MDAAYLVGVEAIDAQHREIFAASDCLQKAISAEDQTHQIAPALQILFDLLVTHFAYEESVMEKIDCADLEIHKHQHVELLDQFQGFFAAITLGTAPESVEHILRHEISSHILKSDMLIAKTIEHLVSRLRVHETKEIHTIYQAIE